MVSTTVVCRGPHRLSYNMREGVDKGVQTDNSVCHYSDTSEGLQICYLSGLPCQPLHACHMTVYDDPCTPQLC